MKKNIRLFWKLYPSYFFVAVVSLLVAMWLVSGSLRNFYIQQVYKELKDAARLISHGMSEGSYGNTTNPNTLEAYCQSIGRLISIRITIILPNGKVICDSYRQPATMDNHGNRPEIQQALGGGVGKSIRYSHTLHTDMMYVAVPVYENQKNNIVSVVRASMPLSAINMALTNVGYKVSLWSVVALLLSAFLCFVISRRISKPIEELTREVQSFPSSPTTGKLLLSKAPSREFVILADAINKMAAQLNERMRTIEEHRQRLDAILSSMSEGIVAIDDEGEIVVMNRAAGGLLGIHDKEVLGKSLDQVISIRSLRELVKNCTASGCMMEEEIVLPDGSQERVLRIQAVPIGEGDGLPSGVLIVISDISRLRQVEKIRKDFVANVSHELKTPITAIKGFAETLLDGAIEDSSNARRFLQIINNHAERMEMIIHDLLTLARLEQEDDQAMVEMMPVHIADAARSAANACKKIADSKQMQINIQIPDDLMVKGNQRLIEQAIINLVDNAIKYSDPGSSVLIKSEITSNNFIRLDVVDEGCGIASEHLDRIFERFYRVDKARSRQLGGTGLGLAIVKHIAQLHGGKVQVSSTPSQGSTFSIFLPKYDINSNNN